MNPLAALYNFLQRSRLPRSLYDLLNDKGLMVFGCARSGTTLIFDLLNSVHEIHITAEYNMHIMALTSEGRPYPERSDTYNYQQRKIEQKRPDLAVETYLPSHTIDMNCTDFFLHMQKHKKYIGDKIASAFLDYGGMSDAYLFQEFANHIPHSFFLLCVRSPWENLHSMQKMFVGTDMSLLIKAYLQCFEVVVSILLRQEKSWLIVNDLVTTDLKTALAKALDISEPCFAMATPSQAKNTRVSQADFEKTLSSGDIDSFRFACTAFEELINICPCNCEVIPSKHMDSAKLQALHDTLKTYNGRP